MTILLQFWTNTGNSFQTRNIAPYVFHDSPPQKYFLYSLVNRLYRYLRNRCKAYKEQSNKIKVIKLLNHSRKINKWRPILHMVPNHWARLKAEKDLHATSAATTCCTFAKCWTHVFHHTSNWWANVTKYDGMSSHSKSEFVKSNKCSLINA